MRIDCGRASIQDVVERRKTHHTIPTQPHLGHPSASQSPGPLISPSSDIQCVQRLMISLFEESPSGLVSAVSLRFLVSVFGNMVGERGGRGGDRVTRELTGSDRSSGSVERYLHGKKYLAVPTRCSFPDQRWPSSHRGRTSYSLWPGSVRSSWLYQPRIRARP